MTDYELIALALTHLDAAEHALGDLGHFFSYLETACGTTVYLVTDEDMLDLGERLAAGERDAYSHWCSDTCAAELTIERVQIAYPSATDYDALTAECEESGDVETLAVLAHLRLDLERMALDCFMGSGTTGWLAP